MAFKWRKNKDKKKQKKNIKKIFADQGEKEEKTIESGELSDKVFDDNKDLIDQAKEPDYLDEFNSNETEFFEEEPIDTKESETNISGKKRRFKRLKERLTKSRKKMRERMSGLFSGHKKIDDDFLEELEEILITSDIGVKTVMEIMDDISEKIKKKNYHR